MLQVFSRFSLSTSLNAFSALAQQGTGTVSGVITDPQNAVITGAEVRVRNLGTNAMFRTKANDAGFYTAPGLPVGDYELSAEMQGFKRSVRTGITLQVNQNAQVDIRLEVGQLAETVEVTAEGAFGEFR